MSEARTWHGTPVVPGVTHGPALVVTSEIAPEAVARFRGLSLDAAAAMAAAKGSGDVSGGITRP